MKLFENGIYSKSPYFTIKCPLKYLCYPKSVVAANFHLSQCTTFVQLPRLALCASPKWTLTKKSIPLAADVYDNESISETDSQMNEGHFK